MVQYSTVWYGIVLYSILFAPPTASSVCRKRVSLMFSGDRAAKLYVCRGHRTTGPNSRWEWRGLCENHRTFLCQSGTNITVAITRTLLTVWSGEVFIVVSVSVLWCWLRRPTKSISTQCVHVAQYMRTLQCLIPKLTDCPPCDVMQQTAQRRIREIIQQVKQQEQKHQQGAAVSQHHSKWPAGRPPWAPANECSPPIMDKTPPRQRPRGTCRADQQHREQNQRTLLTGETSESQRLRALCALPSLWEQIVGETVLIN